jgi:5,10-methylenetetrahydromethanopterin reductase
MSPDTAADLARQAEATGWHGGILGDSQHAMPEAWVSAGLAIAATTTLKIAAAVTNADTRDASVTASAAAAAQWYSGGRFTLGIGRGDSALHKIGRLPARLASFESYVDRVQRYLRGEPGDVDTDGTPSSLWSAHLDMSKPDIDIAATGPKAIAIGARLADGVSFGLGANPDRIRWAVGQARAAGGGESTLRLGAHVLVMATDDLQAGRQLARGIAAIFVRFLAMNTSSASPSATADEARVAAKVSASFQSDKHALTTAPAAQVIDDDFLDRYAIVGPPSYCVERLTELHEIGIDRFWIMPPGLDVDPAVTRSIHDRFAREVIPHLPGQ